MGKGKYTNQKLWNIPAQGWHWGKSEVAGRGIDKGKFTVDSEQSFWQYMLPFCTIVAPGLEGSLAMVF